VLQGVSRGQGEVLHSSDTLSSPTQPTALSRGCTHVRTLLLLPPPQDALQGVHSVQGVHTGQEVAEHSLRSSRSPAHPEARDTGR